eukprot:CAMPEP_0194161118 /NCGR_PEP_ID=MMETSP0152-20130528/78762_1 /TAXON_ID=1049557 /ORGANISM="Thalassiothrix antarctica, Strain L6-D1" /LENGTH=1191 /DNA_ID=CAMNT_0038870871 /DNA_START=67 /DNA_END=3642 /DNA_ORIENTATION=-
MSEIREGARIKEEQKDDEERISGKNVEEHENSDGEGTSQAYISSSLKPKDSQLPLPRPSSTTSNLSSSSNGAPRTTTSRRGGRTRSRSPPTMSNRNFNGGTERDFNDLLSTSENRLQSQSSANPSSAAAAAAAAAKAFSSGGGGSRTPDDGMKEVTRFQINVKDGAKSLVFKTLEVHENGLRNALNTDHIHSYITETVNQMGGHIVIGGLTLLIDLIPEVRVKAINRQVVDAMVSLGVLTMVAKNTMIDTIVLELAAHTKEIITGGIDLHNMIQRDTVTNTMIVDEMNIIVILGVQIICSRLEKVGKAAAKILKLQSFHQDVFSAKGLITQSKSNDSTSTAKRTGGTSRVIGTATPIHVPRAADPPGAKRHNPPAGTPASVFRGRPGDSLPAHSKEHEEDTPQKILLSLRTPSASFEEQSGQTKMRKSGIEGQCAPPLSPEEPPQIQHSHHKHQMDPSLFFEQPNRGSPKSGSSGQGGTIETAPSFSLFNQSFDSLTDTQNFYNAAGTLEFNPSSSFGVGTTSSRDLIDNSNQLLPSSSGAGSFAAGERLLGSSSGGMLTFGMSPANSFGNGPSNNSSRRNSNMMVLGGPDQQPASPTQMLSMYPSYSGGYGSQGSTQGTGAFRSRNGHVREQNGIRSMSSGSFGGSMLYSRSYEASPHSAYNGGQGASRSQDGPPRFYIFLGRNKAAFIKCSFLLPGLKAALLESPIDDIKQSNKNDNKSSRKMTLGGRRSRFSDPSPQDTATALRRVTSAICAFGGTVTGDRLISMHNKTEENNKSIFREKDGNKTDTATVTPSSSTGTSPGIRGSNRARCKYDELLPGRYYENENRLSWEFEESPPVGLEGDSCISRKNESDADAKDGREKEDMDDPTRVASSSSPLTQGDEKQSTSPTNEGGKKIGSSSPQGDQPKMRYRCKLCGLPKQNHTCAYQQSLQRSIGVMIYPAVNAFASSEPGLLAPALTEMNNFISQVGGETSSTEASPSRPTPDRIRRNGPSLTTPGSSAANVTPETMRSSISSNSPNSSSVLTPLRSPNSVQRKIHGPNMSGGAAMGRRVGTGTPPGSSGRKRSHGEMCGGEEDLLFVDTTDLKPEQFRIITPSKNPPGIDAYTYPSLPLPYAQRKRLSDNLFALSKEVHQLTDECAIVLREAREKDMWDLAVAELMTQVVVVIHCHDDDCRFEGLRHYLLTLGIAC